MECRRQSFDLIACLSAQGKIRRQLQAKRPGVAKSYQIMLSCLDLSHAVEACQPVSGLSNRLAAILDATRFSKQNSNSNRFDRIFERNGVAFGELLASDRYNGYQCHQQSYALCSQLPLFFPSFACAMAKALPTPEPAPQTPQ